ncbi:intraflagellar transport protein 56 isoform X3 [Pan paniscus]|uniref:intraflagellar transport protein 56 isoform X3 n=1 Tax=Pan paniscus TaxID=9597 RepID=UPI00243644D2|nr:intraflagellar transport protein 56 isoform X3 [Pan paniscus]XP_054971411.1 intraflagellar transport protein 56 isoform X3 [Pan paniscus]
MMLSRAKPAVGRGVQHTDKRKKKGRKIPKLEELLSKRDFTGAITLLEFKRHVGEEEEDTNLWIGYCAFHLGDYKRALEEYENATKEENCNSEVWVNLACTYFFLGMYKQAEAAGFKDRVSWVQWLTPVISALWEAEAGRSRASKSRLQNRLLFHLAHKAELKSLMDNASSSFEFAKELIRHNLVVFRGGEGALQVLPPLVDVIPEARLNLVIYYLRQDDVQEAYNLIKDLEPTTPQEYILKGVVNAALGQEMGSRDHMKIAQQFFQLVGGSASECDTIPGRQCMASCFFLLKQFDDVLIYLNSFKSYFYNDDIFNFNYAQAKAATGNTSEGEEAFLLIQSEKMKNDYIYLSWLARCYIMNKKPRLAWELYLKMETSGESFSLLQLIANDCYKMGQFYYSAKAFDVLERLDPNPEYWEGKRGACVGIFQMIVAGREPKETLREVLHLLRSTGNTQVEYMIRIMKKWAKENRVSI